MRVLDSGIDTLSGYISLPANLVQDGVLADEDEEDEAAAQQVEAPDQPEDELEAGVSAVVVVGVDQVVHALEYPGDPHHDEQLRVQNLPHHGRGLVRMLGCQ